MNHTFKKSRAVLVLTLLGGTALVACAPAVVLCVETTAGVEPLDGGDDTNPEHGGPTSTNPALSSDEISAADTSSAVGYGEKGFVDASIPIRQDIVQIIAECPVISVVMDSGDDTIPEHGGLTPTNPPLGSDEISTADTSSSFGAGDGVNRQSSASIPISRNMGASSSSQSATERTEAVAQSGATVSASAIENGEGVSISKNPNGGFSISFTGTDD
jgi:hypothetical protein